MAQTQYCARHSTAETDIRCGMCETLICPDCRVNWSDGVRCPDCASVIDRLYVCLKQRSLDLEHGSARAPVNGIPIYDVPMPYLLRGLGAGVATGLVLGVAFLLAERTLVNIALLMGMTGLYVILPYICIMTIVAIGYAVGKAVNLATNPQRGISLKIVSAMSVVVTSGPIFLGYSSLIGSVGVGFFAPYGYPDIIGMIYPVTALALAIWVSIYASDLYLFKGIGAGLVAGLALGLVCVFTLRAVISIDALFALLLSSSAVYDDILNFPSVVLMVVLMAVIAYGVRLAVSIATGRKRDILPKIVSALSIVIASGPLLIYYPAPEGMVCLLMGVVLGTWGFDDFVAKD